MKCSQELADSYELYRRTHVERGYFTGYSILTHAPEIMQLIVKSNVRSMLDYGCGKASFHKNFDIRRATGLQTLTLYDPGVEAYSMVPTDRHDMTVCIDVMEHVPEKLVDEVLSKIADLTSKIAFFSISTRLASKTLVDGTNAHATVRPRDWWNKKIGQMPFYCKVLFDQ